MNVSPASNAGEDAVPCIVGQSAFQVAEEPTETHVFDVVL